MWHVRTCFRLSSRCNHVHVEALALTSLHFTRWYEHSGTAGEVAVRQEFRPRTRRCCLLALVVAPS